MTKLRFTKMQALGNDFIVIDAMSQTVALSSDQIRQLSNRRLGIGCDQVLLAERPQRPDTDIRYRVFNADGGEVEHCGNGVRCLARFLHEKALLEQHELRVETRNGLTLVHLCDDGAIAVNMGPPVLEPERIPFRPTKQASEYALALEDKRIMIGAVSMGNPHAVLQVDDIDSAPIDTFGPLIMEHADFPQRVNVGFMQVISRDRIRLRVYERGAGETPACGTGACAAVVSGRLRGLLDARVKVNLPGGELMIYWDGGDTSVWMTGPALTVYEGEIRL
ncbi:diaminopimelate epimerase [Nitrococcus mobilis]|uniref:Diaminopimelate epimerase n=1 Tax=Nitrococcus mobilis Nb-231 TaxID=314278 RepID=A4BTZ5_9GAMM|nr:diaminopimelate epimerase [Nitrococcus mobilis]EAR20816.1 Diaminopimelate epimerase [Nitrococcus mobilis Nb-231]